MKPGAPGGAMTAPPSSNAAKSRQKNAKPEDLEAEPSPEPRHRPRPKIIEVRSHKAKDVSPIGRPGRRRTAFRPPPAALRR